METAGKIPKSAEERWVALYSNYIMIDTPCHIHREFLKESGLGTPSTRSAVIERLIEVGYIERDGNKLKPTAKGTALSDILASSELANSQAISGWEKRLQDIGKGQEEREEFLNEIKEYTRKVVSQAKHGGEALPDIPKMRRKFSSKKFLEGAAQEAAKMFEDKEENEELDAPCWKCKTGKVITKQAWRSWRCDNKDANCDFVLYKSSCGRPLERVSHPFSFSQPSLNIFSSLFM